jgi:hypothetical protein
VDVSKTRKNIVELAKKAGSDKAYEDDDEALLNSCKEEFSTEDLVQLEKEHQEGEAVHTLMSKRLLEAFRLVDKSLAILEDHDPNSKESSKATRNVLAAMPCYSEIVKRKKKMETSQTSLLSFLEITPSIQPSEPQPSTSGT